MSAGRDRAGRIRLRGLLNSWCSGFCAAALVVLMSMPGRAQQSQPDSYAGFEGRTVADVEVTARPEIDVQAFRSLIQQKAGEPFSMAAVRGSVDALQKTNEFSQVQVSIEPQPNGLRVLFILQPAYYIGLLSFPGATGAFPYTQLLQAVNIPEQSPYVQDQIPVAKQALLAFLSSNGYFAATVDANANLDDAHRIANVTFQAHLNAKARIGDVNIEGLSAGESDDVRRALRSWRARLHRSSLRPGQKYSRQGLQKATLYIRNHLRKEGRLAPVVHLDSPQYDAETNRAAVSFRIEPGTLFSVRASGAHVSQRTFKKLVPIFEENEIDQDLVDEGRRNLVSYFESKGFFDATVRSQMDRQADGVNVVYDISKGTKHKVEGVYFQGNVALSDATLRAQTKVTRGRFFSHGKFSDDLIRESVTNLTALYKNQGFSTVTIQPQVQDFNPQVDVSFLITEGPRDTVHTLSVIDSQGQTVKPDTGGHTLHLGAGKPYSALLLEQDRNQILAASFDGGHLNAHFQSSVSPVGGNPHSIDVVYTIDQGAEARVSDVVLLGNQDTKSSFIQTIIAPNVHTDAPVSEGKFLTAEGDLYSLGTLDWADVQTRRPIGNQTQEEVLVSVHESKRNTVEFGAGIEVLPRSGNIPVGTVALPNLPPIGLGSNFTASQKSFFGPRGSFELDRRNIRGRAETASLALLASRLDQRASLTYTDPHFHGSTWSSQLSFLAERTSENPIFTAELGQVSFQVEKALDKKRAKNLIFRYDFQRTDLSNITIPNLVLPEDQRVRLSTLSAQYIRDTRDNPLDAHHGLYQTFNFGVTPKALGSSNDFVRFLGQTAVYLPVHKSIVWANNVRLGFAVPFAGSAVPLSERFFTGGADTLRGFPIDGAGPQRPVQVCSTNSTTCELISVPVGGDMLFLLNSEGRFPIPIKHGLGGVVFYDGGNTYGNINFHQLISGYTNSVGIGLRYDTPVGPVRFDVGYRLTSVPGVNALQYFVTLGQSF